MTLAKPKLPVGGLGIGPNDLDKPAGDFQVAENVVHRRDGIIEPLPGDEAIDDGWVDPTPVARIFADWPMNYSLRVTKAVGSETGQLSYGPFPLGSGDPTTFTRTQLQPGETQCASADGRHIVSGGDFNIVCEYVDDDEHAAPRRAGLQRPAGISLSSTNATGAVPPIVPSGQGVAYTACVRRKIVGDRYLYSAPCSKVATSDIGGARRITLTIIFENQFDTTGTPTYLEGDEIVVFRTAAFDTTEEINDTYYSAVIYPLTSTDISNRYAVIEDNTVDSALGFELYTNPGQEGSLKANIIPPASCGVETFGLTTFYINKRVQPTVTVSTTGAFGALPVATTDDTRQLRANGIGSRVFTANTTNGSNQLSNVSADDRLGLAVGQFVDHPNLPPGSEPQITSILGAGPYTVVVSVNSNATAAGVSCTSYDALKIEAVKNGTTSISAWARADSLLALQASLLDLHEDIGSDAMRGFVVTSVGPLIDVQNTTLYADSASFNISVVSPDQWDSFDIWLTNIDNWVASDSRTQSQYRVVPSVQDLRRNVVWYSKPNQPEHISPTQFLLIGAGTVYRLMNVQSCMLAFCSDGIYKIDGQGDQWIITVVDNAARIVHPDCAVANTTVAFAWLESGLALCTETGTETVSKDAIGPTLQDYVRTVYSFSGGPKYVWGPQMTIDRLNNDVYLLIAHHELDVEPTFYETYILNTLTSKFTTCGTAYTAVGYSPSNLCVLRGLADGFVYKDSTVATDYKIATVVYLPIVDDAGIVKQWCDVNYFLDNVPVGIAPATYDVEALFGGELTSSTNVFEKLQSEAPSNMFALHSLVPRRAARDVELVFGFRTSTTVSPAHPSGGFYFQFKGASVRARVASQVIKR